MLFLVADRMTCVQDIIAILGMDELSEEDKLTVERARKIQVCASLYQWIPIADTPTALHVATFPSR